MARTEESIEAISAARSCAASRRCTVGGIGLGHCRFDQQPCGSCRLPSGQLCNVRWPRAAIIRPPFRHPITSHDDALASRVGIVKYLIAIITIKQKGPVSDPHHDAVLQLFVLGAGHQRPIDRLPGLRANRADRPMQHRFLRRPGQRQSCKGPKQVVKGWCSWGRTPAPSRRSSAWSSWHCRNRRAKSADLESR